jgi:hypothetical protein
LQCTPKKICFLQARQALPDGMVMNITLSSPLAVPGVADAVVESMCLLSRVVRLVVVTCGAKGTHIKTGTCACLVHSKKRPTAK